MITLDGESLTPTNYRTPWDGDEQCLKVLLSRHGKGCTHWGTISKPAHYTACSYHSRALKTHGHPTLTPILWALPNKSVEKLETVMYKQIIDASSMETACCFVNIPGVLILWAHLGLCFLSSLPYCKQKMKAAEFRWEDQRKRLFQELILLISLFFFKDLQIKSSSWVPRFNIIICDSFTKRLLYAWWKKKWLGKSWISQLPFKGISVVSSAPHPHLKTRSHSAQPAHLCSSSCDLQVSPSAWRGPEGLLAAGGRRVWDA